MKNDVRVLQGSASDGKFTNILLGLLGLLGVSYRVSTASCHRNDDKLRGFISGIEEDIIVFIGGMSLAAPGIIRANLITAIKPRTLVFAIPLDLAARSAIEDLPVGMPIITGGLNTVDVKHSIRNSALSLAQLVAAKNNNHDITRKLIEWFENNKTNKPLVENVELDKNGLIPIKEGQKS